MDLKKLGEILKETRENLNLSIRAAAEKIGLSHSYLGIIEKAYDKRTKSSNRPSVETIQMLAEFYKLDTNLLLELAGYEVYLKETEVIHSDAVPDILKEIGIDYIGVAKRMKDKNISIEDALKIIDILSKN